MALWTYLLKPLLPWVARFALALALSLAVAWGAGRAFIHRAEPDASGVLPPGVPGRAIDLDGRAVHVVQSGAGDPVVLLHGFAGSTYDWEERVLPLLASSHRAIAVDLLGMGFSARADDLPYGYDLWTRQVLSLLDELGIARATLVGHSLGGAVATLVAGEHPDRVARLVLVAPAVPMARSERSWFFRLLEIPGPGELLLGRLDHLPNLPGFSDAYRARARQAFVRRGTRAALLAYLRHGRDTERLARAYRGVAAPTLVVHGVDDDSVPLAAVRRAVPAIANVTLLPMGGVGHWIMRDEPDRLVGVIRTFLAEHPG
jgi:pimeloyl-ACP methyl ester carboxylesterase